MQWQLCKLWLGGLTPFLAAVLGGANSDFLEMLLAARCSDQLGRSGRGGRSFLLSRKGQGRRQCSGLSWRRGATLRGEPPARPHRFRSRPRCRHVPSPVSVSFQFSSRFRVHGVPWPDTDCKAEHQRFNADPHPHMGLMISEECEGLVQESALLFHKYLCHGRDGSGRSLGECILMAFCESSSSLRGVAPACAHQSRAFAAELAGLAVM